MVSMPMAPAAASAKGKRFTSTSCGLWSDMTTSTSPEVSAATSAARSSSARNDDEIDFARFVEMFDALRDLGGCGFALNQRRIQEYFKRRVAAVYDRYEVAYDGSGRGRDDAHTAWKRWQCLFAFRVEKPLLLELALHLLKGKLQRACAHWLQVFGDNLHLPPLFIKRQLSA